MSNPKVVLAYSGGLDTSVAINWIKDQGYDVVACCLDVGEGKDLDFIKEKALTVGAVESYVIDAKEEFAKDFALISLQAHTLYEGKYPLVSALSRPVNFKEISGNGRRSRMRLRLHTVVREKEMTKFVLKFPFKHLIQIYKYWLLYVSGDGQGKKKLNMQNKRIFRFQLI